MKLAFLFAGGREERLDAARAGSVPSEFFYGAIELERAGHKVVFLDAASPGGFRAGLFNVMGRRITPAKMRGEDLVAVSDRLKILSECDAVVATSTPLALAAGVWKRFGRLRPQLLGIHCGLVNHPLPQIRTWTTGAALRCQRVVLFAPAERSEILRRFRLPESAVVSNSFGVDTGFWCPSDDPAPGTYVLAVGNDARRDYRTLIDAVRGLAIPVKIVTRRELPSDLPDHVAVIEGSWHAPAISDVDLRELYRDAALVVVPLEESIQPAGQSVALQAMACGKPVVMTRTAGLWTESDMADGSDGIHLVEPADPESLRARLASVFANSRVSRSEGERARDAVVAAGGIQAFASRLEAALQSHRSAA